MTAAALSTNPTQRKRDEMTAITTNYGTIDVPAEGTVLIEGIAGHGKTRAAAQLTERTAVTTRLNKGIDPDRALAVIRSFKERNDARLADVDFFDQVPDEALVIEDAAPWLFDNDELLNLLSHMVRISRRRYLIVITTPPNHRIPLVISDCAYRVSLDAEVLV